MDNFCSVASAVPNSNLQETEAVNTLSDLCAFHNLYQVNEVTNSSGKILDLILVNDNQINVARASEALIQADGYHPPLTIDLKWFNSIVTNSNGPHSADYYYDFKSADFVLINDCLGQVNWDNLLLSHNIDTMLNIFYDVLFSVIHAIVPIKRVSQRTFPRWFSPYLKEKIILKKQAHKAFKISGSQTDYNKFAALRSECKTLATNCYGDFVEFSEMSLIQHNNVKSFWTFVNSKRKTNTLPSEMFLDTQHCLIGPDLPNLFAEFFRTVYSDGVCYPVENLSFNHINICDCSISISSIYNKLSSLEMDKGPGPDGIPPSLLKACDFVLSRPLFIIFNNSLKLGIFPDFWKSSYLTPIFKSGDKADVRNYRPVCNLSIVPKVFENLVTEYLTSLLGRSVIDEQFGFQSSKSTELNLITYTNYLASVLDGGGEVHSIYTDFSKAFDRVNHSVLVSKLRSLGIGGSLLNWITAYLSHQIQIVKINNYMSYEVEVPSGVPQGSHLGPLLFSLFLNDVKLCFRNSKFLCFADDLKIYSRVETVEDCRGLQQDLTRLIGWCRLNGMDLNPSKCQTISFSRSRNPLHFDYKIGDTTLKLVSTVKDLGVIMDSSLSFIPHITDLVCRALKVLGFVKRCTRDFNNVFSIRLLYCCLVRPLLEYASSVWNPSYACHIHRIESVQRRFIRYIAYKEGINPPENFYLEFNPLYERFSLEPLKDRRDKRDLKLLYKLLNFEADCSLLIPSISLSVPIRNNRSSNTFFQPFYRTNFASNSFIPRVVRLANSSKKDLNFFANNFKSFASSL